MDKSKRDPIEFAARLAQEYTKLSPTGQAIVLLYAQALKEATNPQPNQKGG